MAFVKRSQLDYILQNRSLIAAHMEKHQTLWQTRDNEGEPSTRSNIRVYVRVRPLLAHDIDKGCFSLAAVQPPQTIHFTHPTLTWNGGRFGTNTYEADRVFSSDDSNDAVWNGLDLNAVIKDSFAMGGKETYVLAYGQTGCGKTFTCTAVEEKITDALFPAGKSETVKIMISAFEIRGQNSYDLLSEPAFAPVRIVSARTSDVPYPGLTEHSANSTEELADLVKAAGTLRTTRSTMKNDTSSRSHSIMRFRIMHDDGQSSSIVVTDLAGSERGSTQSQNSDPERVKEAIEINKSLSALKDCIRARISPSSSRVPWRESKLTMVLQRAFESSQPTGPCNQNAHLYVLACVSPSAADCEDTVNTLNYVTPFRLSGKDALEAAITSKSLGVAILDDPRAWDHETSKAWITRNLPKFAPVLPRILSPKDTLLTLNDMSAAELSTRISIPEKPGSVEARVVSQAKAIVPSYQTELQRLLANAVSSTLSAGSKGQKASIRVLGSTGHDARERALKAIDGRDPNARETGLVTRIDMNGTVSSKKPI
ncbi:P-loop containing nucleoside triphosphate hydrolase protein [Punctularia strigosozonata HHB-11173 SS5]|uniref:P-loop containing nucleoside triphosphate hydrolase protein n=1 Tax=Punctularia strigosozonata (strain HHB-11173) TaxID=741275 RepID=UPI0004416D64|nr:P-loop containing nucleoside triphosphate hydrolase protein [Punctularia strigosozonata HHB-11173 SS5]EIN14294.1 P-loop containing nucleoside triphosphate hydrolase protein [Punctularia strigosozonata HHB-11173 SS5]